MKLPDKLDSFRSLVQESATLLADRTGRHPRIAMFLGTGHSEIARRLENREIVLLEEYPEFPDGLESSNFVFGSFHGMDVVVTDAPLAPYLGITGRALSFPVRLFKAMGAEILILSAGAASFLPGSEPGNLALVEDHLDFTNVNPLVGRNDELLGPRFPDMTEPYDSELASLTRVVAESAGFALHSGVFAAIQGPSLPTRAEYRFLRQAGADFVGMSTVPEVIAAVHAGFRVLALCGITQVLDPRRPTPTSLEDMVEAADLAAPRMAVLLTGLLERLADRQEETP